MKNTQLFYNYLFNWDVDVATWFYDLVSIKVYPFMAFFTFVSIAVFGIVSIIVILLKYYYYKEITYSDLRFRKKKLIIVITFLVLIFIGFYLFPIGDYIHYSSSYNYWSTVLGNGDNVAGSAAGNAANTPNPKLTLNLYGVRDWNGRVFLTSDVNNFNIMKEIANSPTPGTGWINGRMFEGVVKSITGYARTAEYYNLAINDEAYNRLSQVYELKTNGQPCTIMSHCIQIPIHHGKTVDIR